MEPILFYGVPQGCSFGSIVALEWLGQPYRLCRIRMPEEVQGALYRQVNSVRETPALLLEDGRRLSESSAILQHLAARDLGRGLGYAQGTPGFDRLNQMLSFLTTSFFAAFSPLWRAYEVASEADVQATLRSLGRELVAKAHADLEGQVEGPWLLGSQRTVADAYFFGIARWADYHRAVERHDFPRLQAIFERLREAPAVAFAQAIEAGEPAVSAGGFRGELALADLAPRLAA